MSDPRPLGKLLTDLTQTQLDEREFNVRDVLEELDAQRARVAELEAERSAVVKLLDRCDTFRETNTRGRDGYYQHLRGFACHVHDVLFPPPAEPKERT